MELRNSGLCIQVNDIKCTPVGYAENMSAATNSKYKLDKALDIINSHVTNGVTNIMLARVLFSSMEREKIPGSEIRNLEVSDLGVER